MMSEGEKCPDCGGEEFFEGPHGGSSINVMCTKCLHTFNWMGPFGMQPIPTVEGVYNRERPRTIATFMSTTQAILSLGQRIVELEAEVEMYQRGMQGANMVVAETKDRLVQSMRETAECRRIIAMDTETVNAQAAQIAALQKGGQMQTFDERAAVAAGWHSASFIRMFQGYMVAKLHLEHIGLQAMSECFEQFEAEMAARGDTWPGGHQ